MSTRCSQCGGSGHNSRTCSSRNGVVKLFGVKLTNGPPIQKSASTGNFNHYSGAAAGPSDGYHSDRPLPRKRASPWTEEEHKQFLLGLQKVGKGYWRDIALSYVPTRTSVQVASHAQKYFMRQSAATSKKRRTSLFDMLPDDIEKHSSAGEENSENNSLPSLDLSLKPNASDLNNDEGGPSHQTVL